MAESNGRYGVESLAANDNWKRLQEQVDEYDPACVGLSNAEAAGALEKRLSSDVRLVKGPDVLGDIVRASKADLVINAVSGAVGLAPTLATPCTSPALSLRSSSRGNRPKLVYGSATDPSDRGNRSSW